MGTGVSAIVLAAGHSERFGEDKLRLGFDGLPLLAHVLEKIRWLGFDEALLVSGDDELLQLGARYGFISVCHTESYLGQSASIKAGARTAAPGNDLMFFVGDQPLLRRQSIQALLECRANNPNKIVLPTFGGKSGSPVIFPAKYRARLLELEGDKGGKTVIQPSDNTEQFHFADAYEGHDIDTREAYERLLIKGSRTVIVRGGGDIATGVVQKLWRTGFRPVILESAAPTAIRRSVALSQAVYNGSAMVEDITARLIRSTSEIHGCFEQGVIPVLIDEHASCVKHIGSVAVIDAIIAKRNIGTHRGLAPITIGLGPGFTAPNDVDVVIETMRGHNLGRILHEGMAMPNTGVPGEVGGVAALRVIHSPVAGKLSIVRDIGETVRTGEILAHIGDTPIIAPICGLLRGMIQCGLHVRSGQKIADIDPRETERDNWRTISDKSRAIGGAVLEALLSEIHKRRETISHEH